MANMSYCRFRNTLNDLMDCLHALEEDGVEGLSREEREAAEDLYATAKRLVDAYETALSDETEREMGLLPE